MAVMVEVPLRYTVPSLGIALVISAPGWRGSAVSLAKIAGGLKRHGHRPFVLTSHDRTNERFRNAGFDARKLDLSNTGPRQVFALRAALRGADAVLVDSPRDLRLTALATLGRGVPIVYRYNLGHRAPRNDLADRLYARQIAATVFQSAYIRELAVAGTPALARRPVFQIPNGFDVAALAPDPAAGAAFRDRFGLEREAAVVLTGSKLVHNKGHDVALDALVRVKESGHPVTWVVCGNGLRRAALEQETRARGLRAIFTGMVDVQTMRAAYNAADVVLHPATTEIFPNVVGEAMACGCAVVGADAGGLPEVLGRDGRSGILVRGDDAARMAGAITELLADPARRAGMGTAARERIVREFPLVRMEDSYTDVFEALARARR
jgi:glycosyltransferase involved in cell wall biosynthesis